MQVPALFMKHGASLCRYGIMLSARDDLTKHPPRGVERRVGDYYLKTTVLKGDKTAGFAEIRLAGTNRSLYVDFCGALREDDGYVMQNARMVLIYAGDPGKPETCAFQGYIIVPRDGGRDFDKKIKPYLDRLYGAGRPSASAATAELFKDHELVTFSEWNFFGRPQGENGTIFNIGLKPGGAMRMIAAPSQGGPHSPVTLWQLYGDQVKCLGFVQSCYDVLFGPGTAQRLGLSTAGEDIAKNLDPKMLERRQFTLYNPGQYSRTPPVGTFFRFKAQGAQDATHVGICLGPDSSGTVRVGHLIRGKVFIESWDDVRKPDRYWRVETLAEPPPGMKPVISIADPVSSLVDTPKPYLKGTTLDVIVSDLRRKYPRFRAVQTELLTDVVYQFNRTKFAVIGGLSPEALAGKSTNDHPGAHFKLRGDFPISLPAALISDRTVRTPR